MNYKLYNVKYNLKENYSIICSQINTSIFIYLGFDFFKELIKKKILYIYNIKSKKKISAIITVVEFKNYKTINKETFYYLIKNPIILIKSIIYLIKSLNKKINFNINKKYLYLLHLVIFKKEFSNVTIKNKDLIINRFYKKILKKHKANTIFLNFKKDNYKANKYYKRNNFHIFYKTKGLIYLKKKFNI